MYSIQFHPARSLRQPTRHFLNRARARSRLFVATKLLSKNLYLRWLGELRRYAEFHTTRERSFGSNYGDRSAGCANRYCRGNVCTGSDEFSCHTIEFNARGTRQIVSKNADHRPYLAGGWYRFHERAKTWYNHVKDRAAPPTVAASMLIAPGGCHAIEGTICELH